MEPFLLKLHLFLVLLCVYSIEGRFLPLQKSVISRDEEPNGKVPTWTCPFKYSDNSNFNESKKWDAFLNIFFCKLSEYKIQAAKRNYRVNNIEEFGKCEIQEWVKKFQETKIDKSNFQPFINEAVKCNLTEYDTIKDITVTGEKIEELNDCLNLTLREKLHVDCKGQNVYIKGNYITAGDIIDILQRNVMDAECKNILSSDQKIFLNIFALSTFFVDVNVNSSFTNYHKIVQLTVIAPKWEVIGESKIELNGEDAKPTEKGIGIHGTPGNPGSPGGNFFGIGREFINGISLEISVSGGNGSHGRDGEEGENGVEGESPKLPKDKCKDTNYCDGIYQFECKKIKCELHSDNGGSIRICIYKMLGESGTKGKNGGEGGKGGKGGDPGNIELIELKSLSQIHQIKHAGQNGADGKGGAGGLGGRKGNEIIVRCDKYSRTRIYEYTNKKTSDERAQSGQNGSDGSYIKGMKSPNSAVVINNLDKTKIINEYKSYVRENLHRRFIKYSLNDFLNHLETDKNVKKLYNTLGLIDELQHLEEQVHKLNTDINFIPFYQSFLNRTSEYAYAPTESGDPALYKKALCYVYTAALGTIHNIEDNLESDLIIDIYQYINSVKTKIDKITDLENSKYKVELINEYKKGYKNQIDKKINEAKELISNEITPEIHNTGIEIDAQMEKLVNAVKRLKRKSKQEREKLHKKQQELQNILAVKGIFTVFKIFGTVVSFLGPVGEVASSVIDAGTTIAEPFVTTDDGQQTKLMELPHSVSELQSIDNKIKIIISQRMTCLRNLLKEIRNHTDISNNTSFEILGMINELDEQDENKIGFKGIQDLETKLVKELQSKVEKSDPSNTKQLAAIKNLEKNVQFCTLLSDSYSKYKNKDEELDAISSAIEQNESNLENLKQYEQNIYDSVIPMLQNIQSDLQDIISKLDTKTKVSLDVTKWHVDSTLRDIILHMSKLTQGFDEGGKLVRCLEKLKEAMDAVIKVHQYIQDYQEDQNLGKYIAEISSASDTNKFIASNPDLGDAVRNLEITVRSNIVVQRYKTAMSAFKQFVFPFAHDYFKDLILPSHLTISGDKSETVLENLVSKAVVELEKIKDKLEKYRSTVTKRDGCHGKGLFEFSPSSRPFFVWKNKKHNDMISRLLSGNIVIVKADVRESSAAKDAIKFKFIDFNFRSKNKTIQAKIKKVLRRFQIFADHLGNSDYRFENNIYEMMTGSQEIWYYFDKNKDGYPKSFSHSYEKINNGTEILSPYASWRLRLDYAESGKRRNSFEELKIYKDSVDLILDGYGYFLNKGSSNCGDLVIDKYYKAIDHVDSKNE